MSVAMPEEPFQEIRPSVQAILDRMRGVTVTAYEAEQLHMAVAYADRNDPPAKWHKYP